MKGIAYLLLSDELLLPEGLIENIAKVTHVKPADIIFLLNKRYDYYDEQDYDLYEYLKKNGVSEDDYPLMDYLIKKGFCEDDYPVNGRFRV